MKKSTRQNSSRTNETRAARADAGNRRKVVVFLSLLAVLSLTTLLLRGMAPTPMQPDAAATLFAFGAADSLDALFAMQAPVQPDRWRYIFLHHSRTAGGNALTLGQGDGGIGDHFIIGNGDGLADGELQISQRWNHQRVAIAPPGVDGVDPACISICLVGDFDRRPPTPMQLRRLQQLVQLLEARCRIPAGQVSWLSSDGSSPASIGRLFPAQVFRDQLPPVGGG